MTDPSPSDGTRRRCPDERPQQILDAALEIFGERGLAGARLEDIARRDGIAKGTIYLYFPHKEALFGEVIRHTIVARISEAEQTLARSEHATATEQLTEYMGRWWQYLCSPPYQTVYRLIVGELHRFPDLFDFYTREVVQRGRALLLGILTRGIARGEFRPVDAPMAARLVASMLISQAFACTTQFSTGAPSHAPDEVRDQVIDFALHALSPAAAGRPAGRAAAVPSA